MSGNDAFDRAVRALRETGETATADVDRTRRRVLETLHRGERRGRRTFWALLPIAAVLAGGAAVAKNSDVVHRMWTGVAETVGIMAPAEKSAPPARPLTGLDARGNSGPVPEPANESANDEPTRAPVEVAVPAEPAVERPVGGPKQSRAPASAKANPPPPTAFPEAPASSAISNDGEAASLQLYKNAYRLHFVEQRYAAAVVPWDEYLRAAPLGRLVVEARYNRAIALVRLDRRGEAESALAPFARGEVSGGYRAREARELLDALNGSGR